jgi:hypothetical protein
MNIVPQDTFTNSTGSSGTFTLNQIVVSSITAGNCANDTLTFKAWDATPNDSALQLGTNGSAYSQVDVPFSSGGTPSVASGQATISATSQTGFTLSFGTSGAQVAGNVYKITVESHQ